MTVSDKLYRAATEQGEVWDMVRDIIGKPELAQMIANQSGLEDRVDIMGVEQFMVANLLERGAFKIQGAKDTARAVIERYNAIVNLCETDPSLKVQIH